LLLQVCALGSQATDDVLVPLLGLTLESLGICLGIFGYLFCSCSRIGQNLLGIAPSAVGMRPGVAGYLLCRCSRIGQSLAGFPPSTVGMRLGISGYLLCRCSRICPNLVSLVLSSCDMLVRCSLGQNQHLKGSMLGVRIG
jgi:hypothetical protein